MSPAPFAPRSRAGAQYVEVRPDGTIFVGLKDAPRSAPSNDNPQPAQQEIILWAPSMPRPRPPRLQREISRDGRAAWYVRRGRGPRIRIRADRHPEFEAEYRAALDGVPIEVAHKKAAVGTLEWLWNCYREATAWAVLSLATRRQRENIMRPVLKQSGTQSAIAINRAHIIAGRDRRKETPAQARHFINTMRGLFRWAADAGHMPGTARQIRQLASNTHRSVKAPASLYGRKTTARDTKRDGRSARKSGCSSACCSTRDCGAAMRCVLADSTSETE
jgi:hypothetical protein